jgi:alpha-beta hydrolase superfamily lysophospholipase
MKDLLCFGGLQPAANESFFAAASQLADPALLRQIPTICPSYLFSGSDDRVGQQIAGVSVQIERCRAAGIHNIAHDSYPGELHEMLNEINRDEVRTNLFRWIFGVISGKSQPVTNNARAKFLIQ